MKGHVPGTSAKERQTKGKPKGGETAYHEYSQTPPPLLISALALVRGVAPDAIRHDEPADKETGRQRE